MEYCKICNMNNCGRHGFAIGKTRYVKEFAGSSPPEVFVGRWKYPNVYTGILSPQESGNTEMLSSPEMWHAKRLPVAEILSLRNKLIYGRQRHNVQSRDSKFLQVMQEVALTDKSVSAEFTLEKPVQAHTEHEAKVPLISHAAAIEKVRLQENPSVKRKVEYLANDTAAKAVTAIKELESSGIATTHISKLLSAGLLGRGKARKLVPTRWSITAVDDTLSKEKLKKIKMFSELGEVMLFNSEYLGNHYEFLLLPGTWSFEVIEISVGNGGVWQDHEDFNGRTDYADSVTGAYYANRLAVSEYLEKIRRQATCIVFREIRPEYTAPLGVGILRQISRDAFSRPPERFANKQEAFTRIAQRLRTEVKSYISKSILLREYGRQKKLHDFFQSKIK